MVWYRVQVEVISGGSLKRVLRMQVFLSTRFRLPPLITPTCTLYHTISIPPFRPFRFRPKDDKNDVEIDSKWRHIFQWVVRAKVATDAGERGG